ncbi:MAG: alpha/beta hydrolase [Betaproteobacteria bacterium]|nr:alpha/beta hydrolase [Betaproteobacteria bacterium]NDF06366.1 alpha/beta hydrolase [Betaproteobacteria bacterium]
MQIFVNGVRIEVEDTGEKDRVAVLLIPGMAMQLIVWPEAMVHQLHQAGYRVIRFDNRDIGLSQDMAHLPAPNLLWFMLQQKLGFQPQAPYSIQDMANDALGVLDHLHINQAHVVGVSMGGMMGQRICLTAPERALSLTSIMSSSGAKGLPGPTSDMRRVLFTPPAKPGTDAAYQHALRFVNALAGPGFEHPEGSQERLVQESLKRSSRPMGAYRQMLAAMADRVRADLLARITTPTLVIHGKADPLVPYACGEDTARRIPNAKLHGIEGMGHDMPPGVVDNMMARLVPFLNAHTPL